MSQADILRLLVVNVNCTVPCEQLLEAGEAVCRMPTFWP